MADRFYSCIVGESAAHEVTEGASTSSEAIELRVSDTAYSNKLEVLMAVRAILQYLETVETNPIA